MKPLYEIQPLKLISQLGDGLRKLPEYATNIFCATVFNDSDKKCLQHIAESKKEQEARRDYFRNLSHQNL